MEQIAKEEQRKAWKLQGKFFPLFNPPVLPSDLYIDTSVITQLLFSKLLIYCLSLAFSLSLSLLACSQSHSPSPAPCYSSRQFLMLNIHSALHALTKQQHAVNRFLQKKDQHTFPFFLLI
jgi:hypothetical protein